MGQKTGTSTSSIEKTPRRVRAEKREKKREEARWAAKSGPVTTRFVSPEEARRLLYERPTR